MEIIAHRGASWDAPENTLAAVRLAWQQQADAVEVDVHLTRDERIVVIHDESTDKVAGRNLFVADSTLEELKTLDVGGWKGADWTGEPIPTLEEVLAEVPAGKRLFIEVKCGPEIVPALCGVLSQAGIPPQQTAVIGYSQPALQLLKQRLPAVPVYPVVAFEQQPETGRWSPAVDELIPQAVEAKFDGLDFGDAPIVDGELVSRCRSAGLSVYVWTVNSLEAALRLKDADVDGIATDRPGWMRAQIAGVADDST